MGCARYVFENNLNTTGSVTFGQQENKRLIPGHGSGKPSNFLDLDYIHHVVHISDEECIRGCWSFPAQSSGNDAC